MSKRLVVVISDGLAGEIQRHKGLNTTRICRHALVNAIASIEEASVEDATVEDIEERIKHLRNLLSE